MLTTSILVKETSKKKTAPIIFVIDSDEAVRFYMKNFAPTEFDVHNFENWQDAILKLEELEPDLILLDILLEDLDEPIIASVIREKTDAPIYFFSEFNSKKWAPLLVDSGAEGCFPKLLLENFLRKNISALIESHSANRPKGIANDLHKMTHDPISIVKSPKPLRCLTKTTLEAK
ncbi:MAG: response regulator [Planctomycetota bacterium]|nr:response regulator [Planctomycetota bacterium]